MRRELTALLGLLMLAAGASVYSWPAGLIILGAGFYLDSRLQK